MATTLPRPSSPAPPAPARTAAAPGPRRQRRWSLALVGVLLTVGSALTFAVLWMNAGDRVPVLAVARDVPAGSTIAAGDLEVVRVSADPGLEPIAAGRRADVVGQTAAVDLVAGTLLTDAHLGEGTLVEAGDAVVGLPLTDAQLPTTDLRPGDTVVVVDTTPPDVSAPAADGTATPAAPLGEGRVLSIVDTDDDQGARLVSLVVDEEVAGAITAAAANGTARLYLVPG